MQLLDFKRIENHTYSKPRCVDYGVIKTSNKSRTPEALSYPSLTPFYEI
jgi:hypothetical protein